MKLGLITSGADSLALFKFLSKYDNEYIIYFDQQNWPYGDKDFDFALTQVKQWINYLKSQWVEKVIVPPVYELALREEDIVLPLFQSYLNEYCFPYSLVGKIWLFGDYADIQVAQNILTDYTKGYQLTENQQSIKKFNLPFKWRGKEMQMWKYFLGNLSYSNFMVNKVIKFDLRYFKDANIDTIIPLNYGYFNYQNTISKYFNFNKMRFHKIDKLEEWFNSLIQSGDTYNVSVHYTWHTKFLEREKKIIWLLQRGKSVEIDYVAV